MAVNEELVRELVSGGLDERGARLLESILTPAAHAATVSPVSTITAGALPTQAFVSGVGAHVSTTRDVQLVVPTATAGTVTVALSPDNATYTTLFTKTTAAIDSVAVRVPAGWYVKFTAVTATLGTGVFY